MHLEDQEEVIYNDEWIIESRTNYNVLYLRIFKKQEQNFHKRCSVLPGFLIK